MKKIFIILFLCFLVTAFSGCKWLFGGDAGIATLRIYDISPPSETSAGTTLSISPDYSLRTFDVTYSYYSPEVVTETGSNFIETSGKVGGEFFDRFEEIVQWLDEQESVDIDSSESKCEGIGVLLVSTEGEPAVNFNFCKDDTIEGFEELKSFKSDLADLFLEEVY